VTGLRLGEFAPDRQKAVTVCLRPFRPDGPRLEEVQLGAKRLVHNYGHGGAGWSLSWGCAEDVRRMLRDPSPVAVIGAGAIGLTTAITLQEAGFNVAIYTEDLPRQSRSAHSTGFFTPGSRLASRVGHADLDRWEGWARAAHHRHLGFGSVVGQVERLELADQSPASSHGALDHRLRDLFPAAAAIDPGTLGMTPRFGQRTARLGFRIAPYMDLLQKRFMEAGGRLVQRRFSGAEEAERLVEPVIVNAAGLGARELFGDESLLAVRGQITWFAAAPGEPHAITYRGITAYRRGDVTLLQKRGQTDDWGFGDRNERPCPAETREAFETIRDVFAGAS
jgi:glycine/D-amino acid oxidase-like deaminating enzyme